MSNFTKELVEEYADKLLIGLSDKENKMILDEFDIINKNMELINKIDGISDVEPMSYGLLNFEYNLAEDEFRNVDNIDEILKNAPRKTNREIIVKKVVG